MYDTNHELPSIEQASWCNGSTLNTKAQLRLYQVTGTALGPQDFFIDIGRLETAKSLSLRDPRSIRGETNFLLSLMRKLLIKLHHLHATIANIS